MKLKEHIEKFDESLLEEKKLDKIFSKNTGLLQEHIEKFNESLGESPTIKSTSKDVGFTPIEQLQLKILKKDKIIENLKSESTNLTNEVFNLEKDKSAILEELHNSKWLENNIASHTKKIYEDKIKKMSILDSSDLIPTLIEVSRKKQGNEILNWGKWLEIPENKYLFQINEDMAKKVFQDTTDLIKRYISNINDTYRSELIEAGRTSRTRGGSVPAITNYFMSFTGNDEHNQLGRNDTARVDMISTQFTPNDPTNKGFDEGSGRKPLAQSGFTISYWWRPDENYSDSFPIGWKRDSNARFSFGIKNASKPYWNVGGSEVKNTTWQDHFDNSGQGHLSGSLLHDQNTNGEPGSGNHLMLGKWYHMVVTYAGTDNVDGDGNMLRKVYLNGYHIYGGFGEAKQSVNWNNHNDSQMTQGLAFGMRAVVASGNHTDGLRNTKHNNGNACGLDEIAIYSEEKDATWVSSVYNGGTDYNHKTSGETGLVGYWRFNEGDGDTVKDLSGYGWHGTLTNAGHGTAIDGTTGNSSTIAGINARFPNAKPNWNEIDESVTTWENI